MRITILDKNGHVKMMLSHVLLEEHTPQGLEIMRGYQRQRRNEEICMKLKKFLEAIHYVGILSNLDMKYDERW